MKRPRKAHVLILALGATLAGSALQAQPAPSEPKDGAAPVAPSIATPQVAPTPPAAASAEPAKPQSRLALSAVFAGTDKPIRAGLVWRIFEDKGGGTPPAQVAKFTSPTPTATLPAGVYVVQAAYGFATATRRLSVSSGDYAEKFPIAAGALKLGGAIEGVAIPRDKLSFTIYVPLANDSEGRLVATGVRPGDLVRVPEGTYHVVSTYGDSNAIMRTDLKVDLGRITEATLNHRAATVTLKLVAQAGGEAFAGTSFSVLTPGGDVIREAIGAFPTVTLAEGNYVVIARHDGKVFTREVKVESGINGDIEIVAAL